MEGKSDTISTNRSMYQLRILPLLEDGTSENNYDDEHLYISNEVLSTGEFNSKIFYGMYNNAKVCVRKIPNVFLQNETVLKDIADLLKLGEHENVLTHLNATFINKEIFLITHAWHTTLKVCLMEDSLQLPVQEVIKQATRGIKYLHDHNITHGNLNPANILIFHSSGLVKLSHFGMPHVYSHLRQNFLENGSPIGVIDWIAPEVLERFSNQDYNWNGGIKSDIFSLGCVSYYTLTKGVHPFGNFLERYHNMMTNQPLLNRQIISPQYIIALPLISSMISTNVDIRPSVVEVLQHPFFWSPEQTFVFTGNILKLLLKTHSTTISVTEADDIMRECHLSEWTEVFRFLTKQGTLNKNTIEYFLICCAHIRENFSSVPKNLKEIVEKGDNDLYTIHRGSLYSSENPELKFLKDSGENPQKLDAQNQQTSQTPSPSGFLFKVELPEIDNQFYPLEEWQRMYLRANVRQLIELTICNDRLLRCLQMDRILSTVDLHLIKSIRQPLEAARLLYGLLQTKRGGYGAMSRALSESKQSGAHEIFRQGYIECLPRVLNINFLGETKQLLKYLSEAEIKEIIQGHVRVFESTDPDIQLVPLLRQTNLPKVPTFYIPRKLFRRNIVNKELFQEKSSDIFVFKGFHDFYNLVQMVRPHIASKSSSQLGNLTCRFIQLEDDEHWMEICDISTFPVHLIKYEEDTKTCVLEQTNGRSDIIKHPNMTISEDTFLQQVHNDSKSGVCICDSPGMGKSLLLANIGNKIAELFPDRLVAFIPLSDLIKSAIMVDIPSQIDKKIVHKLLAEYLAASALAQDILEKILSKEEIRLELLFDAFDEVPPQFISFSKKLIAGIVTKLSNVKIYVTSRPHMRKELEDTLGVLSFDILPFSEANQIDFLVNFWKKENKVDEVDKKLDQFAKYIMDKLKSGLTKNEQIMTGIPLQCRLLAQVYSRNAKRFSQSKSKTLTDAEDAGIFDTCLPKLYTKYIETCFEKLGDNPDCIIQVKDYHVWIALRTLFPEFEAEYSRQFNVASTHEVIGLGLSMGILEKRFIGNAETVAFVHRTFAEYFVSQFLADVLKLHHEIDDYSVEFEVKVARFLLEIVFAVKDIREADDVEGNVFTNSVVVYFLNFLAEDLDFSSQTQILADQFPAAVCKPYQLYTMLFGCLRANYASIFKMLQNIVQALESDVVKKYKSEMIPDGDEYFLIYLINVASVFSSIPLVQALFTFFRECFSYDLGSVCKQMPLHLDTPLHFAIERGDVEKIQYFAAHISLESRKILLSCLIRSNDDPPQIVRRKTEICKMLLRSNRNLLTEANYTLYDSVHVDLIKVLLEAGADARATKSGQTIVHIAARYMRSREFHKLCRFLVIDHKAEYLFLANEPNWKSPLPFIFRKQKNVSVETCRLILGIPGVDVNEADSNGNNLFLIAVQEKHDMELLKLLEKFGADVHATNTDGKNALHLAALEKNTPILIFLLNLGLNYSVQDSKGNSFLHLVPNEEITVHEYQEILSILSAKRKTDIFQMRNEKGQLPIHLAVDHMEVLKDTLKLFKSAKVDFNIVDIEGSSVLMYAAKAKRSVQFLRILVDMGADVMKRNKKGETFTHLISKSYSAEQYHQLAVFLISVGLENAFVVADNTRKTPLHWAALHRELLPGTLELIHRKLVKENKADIYARDVFGWSILMCAAEGKRSINFLKSLLDMGADVLIQSKEGQTFAHRIALHYSAVEYYEILKLLLERGHGKVFQLKDANGATPLHHAVACLDSHPETWDFIKRTLMETGLVNINSTDNNGRTMLISSTLSTPELISTNTPITFIKWNQLESNSFISYRSLGTELKTNALVAKRALNHLRTLVDMGADIYIQDTDGNTFLHNFSLISTAEQYHEMAEFLISREEQQVFSAVNKQGQTAIHLAVANVELLTETLNVLSVSLSIYDQLLHPTGQEKYSHCYNAVDFKGNSVLHWGLRGKRSLLFVQQLVSLEANWSVKNYHNSSLAHDSASFGLIEHLKYFVELGCDVNALDNDGNNVLQCAVGAAAATDNIYEMVTFLLKNGSNKHHRNNKEKQHTAYTYAIEKGITDRRILDVLK